MILEAGAKERVTSRIVGVEKVLESSGPRYGYQLERLYAVYVLSENANSGECLCVELPCWLV